jgi:AcrR family transcriptional regulator
MPKASRPPSVSRERILEAASSRFIRRGYSGTTLGSIAAEIGITTPAIYWHFKSKEELFSAALEQVLMSFVSYVRSSIDAKDPVTRLAQTVAAHVTWQLEQADIASAYAASVGMKPLLAGLGQEHQAKIASIQREYMRELKATIAEGKRSGLLQYPDEGVAAYAIVTMCEYVHVWFKPGGLLTVAQATGQMVRLALRSVGVEEEIALERLPGPSSLQLPN